MFDFNTAPVQRNMDPSRNSRAASLNIREGGGDDGGWLRPSKDGRSQGLDCEFQVTDGEYVGRKFFVLMTLTGDTAGHEKAARISASRIRAIMESASGTRPDDTSEKAQEARRLKSYGDLDGIRFIGKIGLDKGTDGYPPKKPCSVRSGGNGRPAGQTLATVVHGQGRGSSRRARCHQADARERADGYARSRRRCDGEGEPGAKLARYRSRV